jgi:hypothetical protein
MRTGTKILLAGLFAIGVAVASSDPASAWGCYAESTSGSYGYSYQYEYKSDAVSRALEECAARTSSDDVCYIEECDPTE